MVRPKNLGFHQIRKILNRRHPPLFHSPDETSSIPPIHAKSLTPTSFLFLRRNISLSSQFQHEIEDCGDNEDFNGKIKKNLTRFEKDLVKETKALDSFFEEAIGLSKEGQNQESEKGLQKLSYLFTSGDKRGKSRKEDKLMEFKELDCEDDEYHNGKLKNNLRELELELKRLGKDLTKETQTKEIFSTEAVGRQNQESEKGFQKLSNLFSSGDRKGKSGTECKKEDEFMEFKELSPDMAIFANYLYTKGYFVNANFLPNNKFDASCFVNSYAKSYLKFAAEEFAKDHREIYKWLPTADLKKVAEFGCPSLGRKNVFSAKAMRFHFGIQEETVCNKCVQKESCKFAGQSVWKKGAKNMDLAVVMRVITLYALPTRFEVPEDVRDAVNRLLKEAIRLGDIES